MKKLYIGLISAAVIGGIGASGYAYSVYTSPQNEFARNEVKATSDIKDYLEKRMVLTNKYSKKALDKKQSLETTFSNKLTEFNFDAYKDPSSKTTSLFVKGDFLGGLKVSGGVVEKDGNLNIDLDFYNKLIQIPNKTVNEYIKDNAYNKTPDNIEFSLNDFLESFFFTSKSNGYTLSDKQVKDIYKSIDKKAFSKNGNMITLTLDREKLTKLVEKFKEEINKNVKDNKFSESFLNNLLKEAREYDGELVIEQMKTSDTSLVRYIKNAKGDKVRIDTRVDKHSAELVIETNGVTTTVRSEKNNDTFKDTFQATSKSKYDKATQTNQISIVINSNKVSDNEYSIDGNFRVYENGIQDIKKLTGSVKIFDKSLVYDFKLQDDSMKFKYTYDVDVKSFDSNKEKVVIDDLRGKKAKEVSKELEKALTDKLLK